MTGKSRDNVIYRNLESAYYRETKRTAADAVGVARSVIARQWNRFQETGLLRRRPRQGRPRDATANNDRFILLTARRDRTANATDTYSKIVYLGTGRRVSSQTIQNKLHVGGLYARRLMVCILQTSCSSKKVGC
ncbi:hypothetical protein TNCV_635551 [Trichonephila clavipes]|nr:hypothetical protein TNCV_635551 [Trichonephila clavipes]